MSDVINKGTTPAQSGPGLWVGGRVRSTAQRGIEVEWHERVPTTNVVARVQQLAELGFEADAEIEGNTPFSIVSYFAGQAGGAPVLDGQILLATTWALRGMQIEQSLWLKPEIVAQTLSFQDRENGTELLRRFRGCVEAFVTGQTTIPAEFLSVNTAEEPDGSTTTVTYLDLVALVRILGLDEGLWRAFIESRLRGTESFPVPTYALVKQQTWGALATIDNPPPTFGVARVYTLAQIQSIEGLPDNIAFSAPPLFWIKQAPEIVQEPDGKWSATIQWYGTERFDPFVYATL
jgi:hypothetical protein